MTEWKDTTSYAQGDRRNEVPPGTWAITLGDVKLIVTRYHRLEGWWMLCREYGIHDHQDLQEGDIEAAKRAALIRFCELAQTAKDKATSALKEAVKELN